MEALTKWLEQNIASSPLTAIPIALAAGVLISFTPCVYPVLGPTVAFVGARAAGSRWRAFTLSLAYGLGMAIMYAALGAFAALTGRMFGEFTASSPWVQGFIGAVCLLMGLSMLDAFIIELPSSAQSLYTKRFGGAYVNALAAGAVFALIPASCAAPVLLVILAFVAVGKNLLYGISLLFAFGVGVSVLVVAAGTFAGVLTSLPKSGKWMDRIKRGMGWVMVVLGVYFFFHAGQLSRGSEAVTMPAQVSLSDYRGKVVLVTFWASWCESCIAEVPELRRLHEEYHDQGLEVIGINAKEPPDVAIEKAQEANMSYLILLAPEGAGLWEDYDIVGIPQNLLIDRSGVIVRRSGLIPHDIDERIARLLADLAVAPAPDAPVSDREGMVAPDFTLPTLEAAAELEAMPEAEATVGDEVGLMAPDFALPTPDGTVVSLSDYRGRAVLLNLWDTYDGYSTDVVPELRELQKRYREQGLEIIAVNVGNDSVNVDLTGQQKGMTYTLLVGIDSEDLAHKYDVFDIPLFLLIDHSGVIVYRGDRIPDDMDERISQLLQAQPS